MRLRKPLKREHSNSLLGLGMMCSSGTGFACIVPKRRPRLLYPRAMIYRDSLRDIKVIILIIIIVKLQQRLYILENSSSETQQNHFGIIINGNSQKPSLEYGTADILLVEKQFQTNLFSVFYERWLYFQKL